MSGKFPNLSWWLWSGKKSDVKLHQRSNFNSSANSNELESDLLNYRGVGGGKLGVAQKKGRKTGRSREHGKIDKEHDSVVVAYDDGGCGSSSDSESDGSDWSIGWSEPHAPGFLSEDEIDSGFGVLVRCYGRAGPGRLDGNKNSVFNKSHVPDVYKADSQKMIEVWLSSP